MAEAGSWLVIGGAGFVGTAVCELLLDRDAEVVVVDRNPPRSRVRERAGLSWLPLDLLVDDIELPPGRVVVTSGSGEPRPAWPWRIPLEIAVTTARLAPHLVGRDVTLSSSVEVYGAAPGTLREDTVPRLPVDDAQLDAWVDELAERAADACPPFVVAELCRRIAAASPDARWTYGISKLLEERLHQRSGAASLAVYRLANMFGPGQERVVTQLARQALAGRPLVVDDTTVRSFLPVEDAAAAHVDHRLPGTWNVGGTSLRLVRLAELVQDALGVDCPIVRRPSAQHDSSGDVDSSRFMGAGPGFRPLEPAIRRFVSSLRDEEGPVFEPMLEVVVPPRPVRPDEIARRHADAMWSGRLKHGQRWSTEVADRLGEMLGLAPGSGRTVVPTTSGTAALRLAIANHCGPAREGDLAVVPSFTFPATAETVAMLGFGVRFADVDPDTWTMDPADLEQVLAEADGAVRFVMAVDTFGNPADYERLLPVCRAYGVPLLADSAAAIGSLTRGRPVGLQADAHAYSMSFAKSLTAGGAGGAVVLSAPSRAILESGWEKPDRMAELHAIAALDQLQVIDQVLARRRSLVARYRERLATFTQVVPQRPTEGADPVLVHFVVRVVGGLDRDDLASELADLGIGTKPYFRSLHLDTHGSCADRPLPVSELLDAQALALPLSSEMNERDVDGVVVGVERALRRLLGDASVATASASTAAGRAQASQPDDADDACVASPTASH